MSSVARADYAEAAAAALSSDGHAGKTYELASDRRPTGLRAAGEFGPAGASWDVGASQEALFDDGRQFSKLIGRPTTPLAVIPAAIPTRIP